MGRPQNKVKYPGKLLMRLINYIFRDYKIHCIAVFILIFVGVIANVQGTMFTRDLIDKYITPFLLSDGTPNFSPLAHAIERVAVFYGIGIVATYAYNRIMINVTQGMMMNMPTLPSTAIRKTTRDDAARFTITTVFRSICVRDMLLLLKRRSRLIRTRVW